jgi:S-adenosylmethionine:tRNA ribosyltransferase-isomerase
MDIEEFDYDLPAHLIAQEPLRERDTSRLMSLQRSTGRVEHHTFAELTELLAPGDLVVVNDTKVIPARLIGRRASTGGRWEGLFLGVTPDGTWELMSQTRGRLTAGENVLVGSSALRLTLLRQTPHKTWLVRPHTEYDESTDSILQRVGHVPLPPYIRKGVAQAEDRERYQTVYAKESGAIAAPTAGLHFTPRVFARLQQRGIHTAQVTLHVGAGTFQPIKVDTIEKHHMHSEWGKLPEGTATAINACKQRGGRVVAVGTTTVRVLESFHEEGLAIPHSGMIDLFIRPPYRFRVVDAVVTNFHLPRSSLLVLVSAFAGVDLVREAYRMAIEHCYRFYSYGDAMLIV